MKQPFKNLFTVVFCAAVFCSCSKHTVKQITGNDQTTGAAAENRKLNLSGNQKLQVESTVQSVTAMEMMGQSMEINADMVITRQLQVKDKKAASYVISSAITRMNMNSNFMGQSVSYDSDKKEDSASEMGKLMKDQLNVETEIELDNDGKLISAKKDSSKTAAAGNNPMTAILQSIGAAQDEANGAYETFQVLPDGIKINDSWSDSSVAEGNKTLRTYTVKSIEGNSVTLLLSGTQAVNKTMETQGMEAAVTLDSKISGEVMLDKSTGVVKQKTITIDGSGTTEAMGQSIPMTTKVTTTSVVKSL